LPQEGKNDEIRDFIREQTEAKEQLLGEARAKARAAADAAAAPPPSEAKA
jgi:hypothetical protein